MNNQKLQAAVMSLHAYLDDLKRAGVQPQPLEGRLVEALIQLAEGIDLVHQDVLAIKTNLAQKPPGQ